MMEQIESNNDLSTFVAPWETGRNYERERDIYDRNQLFINEVSDPEYLQNTFDFYKSTGSSLTDFLKQFDILKLKRMKFKRIREEYNNFKNLIKENEEQVKEIKKLDPRDLVNREKKKLKSYLYWTFNIQRYKYYDSEYMDDVIELD
jgi:uncharacterized protein YdcH (DUF465 family)